MSNGNLDFDIFGMKICPVQILPESPNALKVAKLKVHCQSASLSIHHPYKASPTLFQPKPTSTCLAQAVSWTVRFTLILRNLFELRICACGNEGTIFNFAPCNWIFVNN